MLYASFPIPRCLINPRFCRHASVALLLLFTTGASASDRLRDEVMRRDLAVIQTQLDQVEWTIQRLEQRQAIKTPDTHRFYFDTDQLRRDLDVITAGIDDYLQPPRLPPRNLAPLTGDYLKGGQ